MKIKYQVFIILSIFGLLVPTLCDSGVNFTGTDDIEPRILDSQANGDSIGKASRILAESPKDNAEMTTVHMIVHSHMDLGWIYTIDEYYRGTHSQDGGCVSCILNHVVDSLAVNPERKYTIAEVGFFQMWWNEQEPHVKEAFLGFLKNGQIDFVSGGWVTNDEACTYYEDIIDQFIVGQRWMKENLGQVANIGWQIDPFGHSKSHAALMAQMGYEGLFFGRIDYIDWETRRTNKSLEFNWKPGNPRGETILSRLLHTHYSDTKFMVPDNYYCRSIYCKGDLSEPEHQTFKEYMKTLRSQVRTPNVLFLVGDDFHLWQESEKDYRGIENTIKYFEERPEYGIKVKFSGLGEYIKDLAKDYQELYPNTKLPEKSDDFFPYIENTWATWVGYFTSKSMFKMMARDYSRYYNAAKLIISKFSLRNEDFLAYDEHSISALNQALEKIEQALAVAQHHDAITGTMKEYVKEDYERRLVEGKNVLDSVSSDFSIIYK